MGKKNVTKVGMASRLEILDAVPADTAPRKLLIKNTTTQLYIVASRLPGVADVVVDALAESVLDAAWLKNPILRRLITSGVIAAEWVSEYHEAKVFPVITDAPEGALPDLDYDREYARQIALLPQEQSLASIAVTARQEGTGETDGSFMKTRFMKILKCAEWLEKQVQGRKPVLAAIKDRMSVIREM